MREIAADADALVEGLERRPRRARQLIVERDVAVDEITDRLDAAPAGRRVLEQIPGDLAQPIGFAISAAEQVDEAGLRQVGDGDFCGVEVDRITIAAVLYGRVAPDLQRSGRCDEAATFVAEQISIHRGRDRWRDREGLGLRQGGAVLGSHRQHRDEWRRLSAIDGDIVSKPDQHSGPFASPCGASPCGWCTGHTAVPTVRLPSNHDDMKRQSREQNRRLRINTSEEK